MYGFFRSSVSRVDAGGKKKKTRTQPQDDRGGFLVWDGKPRHSLKMTMGFSKHLGARRRRARPVSGRPVSYSHRIDLGATIRPFAVKSCSILRSGLLLVRSHSGPTPSEFLEGLIPLHVSVFIPHRLCRCILLAGPLALVFGGARPSDGDHCRPRLSPAFPCE